MATISTLLALLAVASSHAVEAPPALGQLKTLAPAPAPATPSAQPQPAWPFHGITDGTLGPDLPVGDSSGFPASVYLVNPLLNLGSGQDFDGDGLSDLAETEIAYAFRALQIFDTHENARSPREPVTLFQVRPVGCVGPSSACGDRPLVLRVVYLNLWERDGGYGPASTFCRDRHIGDNQTAELRLASDDNGRSFHIKSVNIGAFDWPKKSGRVRFLGGTHFWFYFSSGKHHQFFDTFYDHRASPYSNWSCHESLDGKGFFDLAHLRAPASAGFEWNNAGEPEAHPAEHFVNALDAWGFPGEDAWGTKPFCGGVPCKPGNPTNRNINYWVKDPFYRP